MPIKRLGENLYPILGSFIILFFRYFLTRFVFVPVGLWFGLKDVKRKKPSRNLILEQAYRRSKKWTSDEIVILSKRSDLSREEVKEWLRLKASQNKASVLKKIVDSFWSCCYHCLELLCGCVVLLNKSWFWNINECWTDLPNHTVSSDLWWFSQLCASYCWSQLLGLIFDVRRKDFVVMFSHHVVVLGIYVLALSSNMFRIGSIAAFVMNIPDAFLEVSKMAKYVGFEEFALYPFLLFAVIWIIVRLGLEPFYIFSYLVDVPKIVPPIFTPSVYNALRVLLFIFFILNCVWTYFVLKAVYNITIAGLRKDSRSDSESED